MINLRSSVRTSSLSRIVDSIAVCIPKSKLSEMNEQEEEEEEEASLGQLITGYLKSPSHTIVSQSVSQLMLL